MTNPRIRAVGKSTRSSIYNNEINNSETMSNYPPTNDVVESSIQTQSDENDVDGEEFNDDDASCSSFNLQECINEFHARRIRRISAHSREAVPDEIIGQTRAGASQRHVEVAADADEINDQNRINKEHERKCKPCKDGFCYCFTSDSGDGGGGCNNTRGMHVRQLRRNKRYENNQLNYVHVAKQTEFNAERRRDSEPIVDTHKSSTLPFVKRREQPESSCTQTTNSKNSKNQITAISRMEAASKNAPLIHIIQELRDNFVISEVRVNRHKIDAQQTQRSHSLNLHSQRMQASPKKLQQKNFVHDIIVTKPQLPAQQKKQSESSPMKASPKKKYSPTAPTLDKISEIDSLPDGLLYSSPLNSSSKSNGSTSRRRSSSGGGKLLEKRLSYSNVQFKPHNHNEPPPKPPRSHYFNDDKTSVTTLSSTSSSVREAEQVVDDFLRSRGVKVPTTPKKRDETKREYKKQFEKYEEQIIRDKRKSYPFTKSTRKTQPISSYPSLSDIERFIGTNKETNYTRNMRQESEKHIKEISFGWKEPKITDMLSYDRNGNHMDIKTHTVQAQPQTIGWQMPHKIDLDTVDGIENHNLAANIDVKETPVKERLFTPKKNKHNQSQKFIWGEQLRNLSPWNNNFKILPKRSNLKSSSRAFLKKSKNKILRLVSPKKDNKNKENLKIRKTPIPSRTVGIQTSCFDLRSSITPQSPPGSYHSAIQPSSSHQSSSTNNNEVDMRCFDFNRVVQAPVKKAARSSHRRLNFPFQSNEDVVDGVTQTSSNVTARKTYRSYHTEIDQDVSVSKMGYILNNIRAKLEASDVQAEQTFQEIQQRERQNARHLSYNPDFMLQTRVEIHPNQNDTTGPNTTDSNYFDYQRKHEQPTYSEIEEESMHIIGCPQVDNKNGIENNDTSYSEPIYAKVNKVNKAKQNLQQIAHEQKQFMQKKFNEPKNKKPTGEHPQQLSLGKILHDSLKYTKRIDTPLPPLPEPPIDNGGESNDNTTNSSITTSSLLSTKQQHSYAHSKSLNNIRVMEQHSPPKRLGTFSKSDLSLQHSKIFHENLYRSELITQGNTIKRLEKVNNHDLNKSYISSPKSPLSDQHNDSMRTSHDVSYELPPDDSVVELKMSEYSSSSSSYPFAGLQSTPKKLASEQRKTFTTKLRTSYECIEESFEIDSIDKTSTLNIRNNQTVSCPNTPQTKLPIRRESLYARSLPEVLTDECPSLNLAIDSESRNKTDDNKRLNTFQARFKQLKKVVRKSLRRGRNFVRLETNRLSTSLYFPKMRNKSKHSHSFSMDKNQSFDLCSFSMSSASTFNLDNLFIQHDAAPVRYQIANAVSICRQLPNLEISAEMVEAERLLLFSDLRLNNMANKPTVELANYNRLNKSKQLRRFFIDEMRLPIKADPSQDIFFNYFYICTFYCGGRIRSTQSAECCNHEAIFRDCGIEFAYDANATMEDGNEEELSEIDCKIFMLRLRKISTLSLETHRKPIIKLPALPVPMINNSSGSSTEEIVSRFRLHAAFTLKSSDFKPYEYVESVSKNTDINCLRSASTCQIPLISHRKSTNLTSEIQLIGRSEVRFAKRTFSGFLNVQDPHSLHNWNRRWCSLAGLKIYIWHDADKMEENKPILSLDLRCNAQTIPLENASSELCARSRSFCLQCMITKSEEEVDTAAVFFAAESQKDLDDWLYHLNIVLKFINTWM